MVDAYNDTAERFVRAASASIDENLPESAGFLTYHAFESAGGALTTHLGMNYSTSHPAKLNQFRQAAIQLGNGYNVALVAVKLGSLRSKVLYPKLLPDGTVVRPRDVITRTQAAKLRGSVRGIVQWVRNST
jgi:hypothetical protein